MVLEGTFYSMSVHNTRTMTPFLIKYTYLLSMIEQTCFGTATGAYEADSGHCILALCGKSGRGHELRQLGVFT
jgi:hypothetical protein